jgi:hypothetical protein
MKSLGIRTPVPNGRGDRGPPTKSPIPGPRTERPSHLGASTPRRGGLCTPAMRAPASPRHIPLGLARSATHRVGMKCLGIRTALPGGRTECVPPRKSPFALSPGSPRKAIRHWLAHPSEGRAPHAREERDGFDRGMCPVGHRPFAYLSAVMPYLGLRTALPLERGDRAPPRKSASSLWQGFPRAAIRAGLAPPGGAGSARPRRRHRLHRRVSPLGHRPMVIGPGGKGMPRHSYGRTVRTRRPRPSEKTTFHAIPGLAKQASLSPLGRSAEGRALHARNEGTGFTEAYPARPRPLGYASGRNEMPRHPYGLARRTHRVRPSEETAPRVIPGFSPARRFTRARPTWRGGLRTPARNASVQPRHLHLPASANDNRWSKTKFPWHS